MSKYVEPKGLALLTNSVRLKHNSERTSVPLHAVWLSKFRNQGRLTDRLHENTRK